MKRIKIFLSALSAVAILQSVSAQDIQLNINTIPASIAVGDTANILVDVCNVDANPVTAPANKIRTLISTSGVMIIGATDVNGGPITGTGWSILSLSTGAGNSIRLEYNHTLDNAICTSFYVTLVGTAIGANVFTGTFQWGGQPTISNNTLNDVSRTAIVITAAPLTSFTAKAEGQVVQLRMATTEESNSDHFDIERSLNGKDGTTIGTKGAGLVIFYPNPVKDRLKIKEMEAGLLAVGKVQLLDIAGKVVHETSNISAEGIDMGGLAPGVYLVKVTHKDGSQTTSKIVKQ